MQKKPRVYSTVPVEVFKNARCKLTNQQLRLFLFLEFKAGSDSSGIDSDDPDLEGCRYVRMNLSTITERMGFHENYSTRRMLNRLKKFGFIIAHSENFVLLPEQGRVDRYFQNFECLLFNPYWKLFAILLVHKRRRGEDFVVTAGRRFLLKAGCGGGRNRQQQLIFINEALAELQRLGFIESLNDGSPQIFRIRLDAVSRYAEMLVQQRSQKQKKVRRRTNIETPPGSAITPTLGSAVAPTKENPFSKNPSSSENPLPKEGGEQKSEGAIGGQLGSLEKDYSLLRKKRADSSRRLEATLRFQLNVEDSLGMNTPRDRKLTDTMDALSGLHPDVRTEEFLEAVDELRLEEKVWPVLITPLVWERLRFHSENLAGIRLFHEHEISQWCQEPDETALESFRLTQGVEK